MSSQVRIDDDVADALRVAIELAGGVESLSHAANAVLRRALQLPVTAADSVLIAQTSTQSVSRARATAARARIGRTMSRR